MNYNAFIIVTSKYGYTAKDEQSHHGCYQSGSTTANTGGVRVPSMTSGRRTHKHSNTAPSLGDQGVKCTSFVAVDEVQDSYFHPQELKTTNRMNQILLHWTGIQKNVGLFLIDPT